jgi:predicted MFS family arabinose efflux permease
VNIKTNSVTEGSGLAEWRSYWLLPLAAALGYSNSVFHIYALGPFIEPLQQAFGWSRGQISGGLTMAAMVSLLFSIPVGILIDRIGPRRIGLFGVLAMGVASALLGTATGSIANWLLLWTLIAFAVIWVQATVWTSAVASRFERSRGLAFAVTLSGASISAMVFPVLATWLIDTWDWRIGFVGLPAIWVALVFPVLFFGFRGARDGDRRTMQSEAKPAPVLSGLTLAEGLRSAALYKLLLASGLFAFTAFGAVVHFVPILTDSGASSLSAAGIASLIGIFSIVGRLGTGLLLDRFPGHVVGGVAFLLPAVALSLLLIDGGNPLFQIAAAATLGLTVGSEVDVIAFLAAKHFGLKSFGALYGALIMALGIGIAIGPLASGMVFDSYGSYQPFLALAIGLMVIGSISLLSLGRAHDHVGLNSQPEMARPDHIAAVETARK